LIAPRAFASLICIGTSPSLPALPGGTPPYGQRGQPGVAFSEVRSAGLRHQHLSRHRQLEASEHVTIHGHETAIRVRLRRSAMVRHWSSGPGEDEPLRIDTWAVAIAACLRAMPANKSRSSPRRCVIVQADQVASSDLGCLIVVGLSAPAVAGSIWPRWRRPAGEARIHLNGLEHARDDFSCAARSRTSPECGPSLYPTSGVV